MATATQRRARRTVIAVVAFTAALIGSPSALAGPPSTSAVGQYVEVVPTSAGGQAVGVAPADSKPARLPAHASAALRQLAQNSAAEANQLRTISTSPVFGAPDGRLGRRLLREPKAPAQIPAALDALTYAGGPVLPLLGAALLLSACVAIGAAFRRTHSIGGREPLL